MVSEKNELLLSTCCLKLKLYVWKLELHRHGEVHHTMQSHHWQCVHSSLLVYFWQEHKCRQAGITFKRESFLLQCIGADWHVHWNRNEILKYLRFDSLHQCSAVSTVCYPCVRTTLFRHSCQHWTKKARRESNIKYVLYKAGSLV